MTCPANGNLGPHRCGACDNDVEDAEERLKALRESLREMVTLVEQVEAFPSIIAQHQGLTPEGQEQLKRAEDLLAKEREPNG